MRRVTMPLLTAVALLLAITAAPPPPMAHAAGVVAAPCTEAELASALAGGGTVTFDCGPGPTVITVTSEKVIAADTTIDGGGTVTLRGSGATRVLRTVDGTYTTQTGVTKVISLTLANITIENGVTDGQGGGVEVGFWNSFTARNVTFRDNRSTKDDEQCAGGGAIFIGGGSTALIEGSVFTGNRASNGGAINSLRSNLTIRDSRFEDNHATHSDRINGFGDCGGGGAVYIDGARNPESGGPRPLVISGSRFIANTTNNHGAGLFVGLYANEAIGIERSLFDGNVTSKSASLGSSGTGGAIWYGSATGSANNAVFTLASSTLANNRAVGQGGGLWTSAAASVTNVTFYANRAEDTTIADLYDWRRGNGGALAVNNGAAVSVNASTFAGNFAGFNGAAIAGPNSVTVRNTIFANNTSANGWGIQQHCTNAFPGGGNIQFPDRTTSNWNDYNCGATIRIADPQLGPLADNGGDTPTMAPGVGSPAVNAGDPATCPGADQRGYTRSGPCDVGALEVGGEPFAASEFVYLPISQR
jgi:hypothetical protein